MAPEQARGLTKEIGPAADVYALGAILCKMLTGRPPFKGESAADTMVQVIGDEPVPPRRLQPKCPRDLETICLACLHKEPHRRYASASALADDLGRFLAGRPIQSRPTGPLPRAWKWARRNPGKVVVLAALLLVLVGLALWQRAIGQDRETVRREDAADYAAVRAHLAADRIEDAREALNRGLGRVEREPSLAAQRGNWDGLRAVVLFFHRAEEAWFRAGEERYEEGRSACEAGLRHLGILDDGGQFVPGWWDRLPVEVAAEQADRLHQEVYQQLLLLTYLRTVASLSSQDWRTPEAAEAFRSAGEALDQAQAYERARQMPPAQTVIVFRALLQELLRAGKPPRRSAKGQERAR
jgi:hypothetical protein